MGWPIGMVPFPTPSLRLLNMAEPFSALITTKNKSLLGSGKRDCGESGMIDSRTVRASASKRLNVFTDGASG